MLHSERPPAANRGAHETTGADVVLTLEPLGSADAVAAQWKLRGGESA